MKNVKLYTAIGYLKIKKDGEGHKYPVIVVNREEYAVDQQEAAVWTALCWRLCGTEELKERYADFSASLPPERRTLERCLMRLVTRGLAAEGCGETQFEALYDLLSDLYIMPVSQNMICRIPAFLSLVLCSGVPVSAAAILFRRDHRTACETHVMMLSNQALLSTAELIKCVEVGATDVSTDMKLLDALYVDPDTTSDNIGLMMRTAKSREPVTVAVANLYLRKQIILERV